MGVKAILAMGPVLLAVYGILRIGISIGVRRATKNVVAGFLMKAELSEVTLEGKGLVAQLAKHDYWYNLFGPEFSRKERRKKTEQEALALHCGNWFSTNSANARILKLARLVQYFRQASPGDHSPRKPKPVDCHSWLEVR